MSPLKHLDFIDWVLLALMGVFSVLIQQFKFIAYQHDSPGKLANFQYLIPIYQFAYDILIF